MNLAYCLSNKGLHTLILQGKVGSLEAKIQVPQNITTNTVAMLGHPHSLFGGSMDNKVVTTMERACKDLGIRSIRFNFRGVGKSEGKFDNGIGESEDMQCILQQVLDLEPNISFILAGFSFGSYVTYRVALNLTPLLLLSIAPPVERFDYSKMVSCPWVVIQGLNDDVVNPQINLEFATKMSPPIKVITFNNTGHFFHGQLLALRETIVTTMQGFLAFSKE
ncbi:MAG: hypothetical protein A3F18_06865 [Legionellales bacterium RIFCSPHIGHO2_12_FULL_37_14]|nr:MAG: hypothetical protein A3F18_06865 [Legionellales bacterium RIFCSPHIGHO2_12_FULL_37_14]